MAVTPISLTPGVLAEAVVDLGAIEHNVRVLREHAGGRVLIVGHSDTVPKIVARLSGNPNVPEIGDREYGTMYIVSVPRIGHANLLRLSY